MADARRRDDDATRDFVERFAAAMVEGGMPRMPARAFAVLLTEDEGGTTAAHLAETLQASPAAVSGAVRYLSQVRLITRIKLPGDRHETYRLRDEGWYEVIYDREAEVARWAALARQGEAAVGASTPAGQRLADTAAFFEFLQEEMPGLLARWRARSR